MALLKVSADRRAWRRRALHDIPGMTGVRLASEHVDVIDVSAGGILVEGAFPVRPGAVSQVEFLRTAGSFRVRGRALRCHVAALDPSMVRYRIAIAFDNPVAIVDGERPAVVQNGPAPFNAAMFALVMQDTFPVMLDAGRTLNRW